MSMYVMKFGGASVKNADSVRNVCQIIAKYANRPLIVVISAMDKTTNELELLTSLAEKGEQEATLAQYQKILKFHLTIAAELFPKEEEHELKKEMETYFHEIQQMIQGILMLKESPPLMYDRIVAYGELLSTRIVAHYLQKITDKVRWWDARQTIKTDMQHGQAKVLWSLTNENVNRDLRPLLATGKLIVTQGFIASTLNQKTTTLGREGSDFSAAIFAYCLEAEKVIIWKDVSGVLNADPKRYATTIHLPQLSYDQAVQMTFYGATVIHPKTIQPLYIRKIPLYVKSFQNPDAEGTCISEMEGSTNIPIYTQLSGQLLVSITAKNFSFMETEGMQAILHKIQGLGIKIHLIQSTARELLLCMPHSAQIQSRLNSEFTEDYHLHFTEPVTLETVLHYTPADLNNQPYWLLQIQEDILCRVVSEK